MKKLLLPLFFLASCQGTHLDEVNPIDTYFNLNGEEGQEAVIRDYMNLLNRERLSLGLSPLTFSVDIGKEAESHSADMAQGIVPFGDEGKDTRCDNLKADFPATTSCEEIVAKGRASASAVLSSWLKSDYHKAILLNPGLTYTGVSFVRDSQGVAYWTQVFLEGIQ